MTTETTDRIEELQELKQEYIFTKTADELGQKSVSWGELADMQADAESRWNETDERRELALLERGADETTIELYKALKAMLNAFDIGQKASPRSAIGMGRAAIRKAEGEN